MKKLLLALALLLMGASPSSGMQQTYHSFSEGGFQVTRDTTCYITDDSLQDIYKGSLNPNESFSLTYDWCSPENITLGPQGYWEGVSESMLVNFIGKGNFSVEVTESGTPIPPKLYPYSKGYENWKRCATYHYRTNIVGAPYGYTTIKVTNIGSRASRDVSLYINMQTDSNEFLSQCPRDEWGF